MNIYKIPSEFQRIWFAIEENGGEITPEQEEELKTLLGKKEDALEWLAKRIKEIGYELEAVKEEKRKLTDRGNSLERQAERLKALVFHVLGDFRPWKHGTVSLSWRANSSIEITDEDKLPPYVWREKTTREVSKEAIKAELQSGASVPGARLVERHHLQIK